MFYNNGTHLFLAIFSGMVATVTLHPTVFFLGIFSNSLTTSPSASFASRKLPMDSFGILAGALKAFAKLSARMSGLDLVNPWRFANIIAPIPRPLDCRLPPSSPERDPPSDLSDFVDLRDPLLPAMFRPHLFLPLLLVGCWLDWSSMLPLEVTRLDVEDEVVFGCKKDVELLNREVEEVEGMIWAEEEVELNGAKDGEEVEDGKGLGDFFKEAVEELRSRFEAFTVLIIDSSRDLILS